MSSPTASSSVPVGRLIRQWRQRRRLSQLDLASEADISARHLSFVETGRSLPSRGMVLRLAERLQVPLRERNRLLHAAGYAPLFRERPLDDPDLRAARVAIDMLLAAQEPFPALAVDRHWTMVAANRPVLGLLGSIEDASLLQPPVNVLRLSLHPRGLAPRIVNLAQWRGHLLARLHHQVEVSADPVLDALLDELRALPLAGPGQDAAPDDGAGIVVPLRLASPAGVLNLISTTTVFGTPVDVTLAELAIESFFPADEFTAQALRNHAAVQATV
jgi:transcriptional regulator with XRE-family HTH domain